MASTLVNCFDDLSNIRKRKYIKEVVYRFYTDDFTSSVLKEREK